MRKAIVVTLTILIVSGMSVLSRAEDIPVKVGDEEIKTDRGDFANLFIDFLMEPKPESVPLHCVFESSSSPKIVSGEIKGYIPNRNMPGNQDRPYLIEAFYFCMGIKGSRPALLDCREEIGHDAFAGEYDNHSFLMEFRRNKIVRDDEGGENLRFFHYAVYEGQGNKVSIDMPRAIFDLEEKEPFQSVAEVFDVGNNDEHIGSVFFSCRVD